jgi:hypothetical protein
MVVFIFKISLFILKIEEFYKALFLSIPLTIIWIKPPNVASHPIIIAFYIGGIKNLVIPLATVPPTLAIEASKPILFPIVFKP